MIETILLKFTEAAQPLRLDAEGVTILVGPNNSGKSLLLREIERKINEPSIPGKIVADVDVSYPSVDEFKQLAAALNERAPEGSREGYVHLFRYSKGAMEAGGNDLSWYLGLIESRNKDVFMSHFINFFVIRLDGRTRFSLVDDRERGDLSGKVPVNFIAKIFMEDPLREAIREVCLDAFNKYFVLDPTSGSNLKIRLSSTPPPNDEQSLNAAARQFHAAAQYIKDASDGVQAFLGIIMAVFAGDYTMVLLDEPEAFLHPPLARKLGYRLALRATQRKEALFSATHSADFLMGCLQGTSRVKVLRLEYSDAKSKGTLVDSDALLNFLSKPLIRNSNVISALFHDGVVVTESENDRAFYSEIYHRLADEDKGLPSLLFVSAQNKQTIRDMIGPLRGFGVPAAGIVDIDILKEAGHNFTGWLKAAQVPTASHTGMGQARGTLKEVFDRNSLDMKKKGGVAQLGRDDREAANNLFDSLEQYGVFVIRSGELEAWLPSLQAVGQKTEWTISALQKMGSDPTHPDYVRPANDDVWHFMRTIVKWIKDPSRKGTT